MRHGSLFTGIGGFDLAASWMGWQNIFQVEKDIYCQNLLQQNFPETQKYLDIKNFNAKKYYETIDIISGGFPCQPFSTAGQRKGKNDDRFLWPEMLRCINEIKPTYAVCENVYGIVNMELDKVLFDLENINYTTETFVIPACAKNAWHRRDRVWIIAYTNNSSNCRNAAKNERKSKKEKLSKQHKMEQPFKPGNLRSKPFTNINGSLCNRYKQPQLLKEKYAAPKCNSWWKTEPGVDRVVDGLPNRMDRVKGLGNAIVPQIAFEIFKAIQQDFLTTKF